MPAGTIRDGKHKDMTSGARASGSSSSGVVIRGDARGAVLREPSVVVIRGIAELEAENQELRRQLMLHEKHASSHPSSPSPSTHAPTPFWLLFCVAFISAVLTSLLLRYVGAH